MNFNHQFIAESDVSAALSESFPPEQFKKTKTKKNAEKIDQDEEQKEKTSSGVWHCTKMKTMNAILFMLNPDCLQLIENHNSFEWPFGVDLNNEENPLQIHQFSNI